jgi:hypothetical protein
MFDIHTLTRGVVVLVLLRRRQLRAFLSGLAPHLLVRQEHLQHALVAQVRPTRRARILPGGLTALVQGLVRERARMTWLDGEDFASGIGDDLRLEGVALLLAGVELPLRGRQTGAADRRLETIYQQ